MKLLFDHNLSPTLVTHLKDIFPDAAHMHPLGLDTQSDQSIWQYAKQHAYTIVTKDSDFNDLLTLNGYPPKVIWIKRGNCKTRDIEQLLRKHDEVIEALELDTETGILILV